MTPVFKALQASQGLRVPPARKGHRGLKVSRGRQEPQARQDQLDRRAHKDLRVRRDLKDPAARQGRKERMDCRGLKVRKGQPGRRDQVLQLSAVEPAARISRLTVLATFRRSTPMSTPTKARSTK